MRGPRGGSPGLGELRALAGAAKGRNWEARSEDSNARIARACRRGRAVGPGRSWQAPGDAEADCRGTPRSDRDRRGSGCARRPSGQPRPACRIRAGSDSPGPGSWCSGCRRTLQASRRPSSLRRHPRRGPRIGQEIGRLRGRTAHDGRPPPTHSRMREQPDHVAVLPPTYLISTAGQETRNPPGGRSPASRRRRISGRDP